MKYKCPYCGNKSFSLWQKILAGGMTSKGVKCPSCGHHAVHGMKSTIYKTVVMTVVLVFCVINSVKAYSGTPLISVEACAVLLVGVYIVFCKLINGLLFDLDTNNRMDIR